MINSNVICNIIKEPTTCLRPSFSRMTKPPSTPPEKQAHGNSIWCRATRNALWLHPRTSFPSQPGSKKTTIQRFPPNATWPEGLEWHVQNYQPMMKCRDSTSGVHGVDEDMRRLEGFLGRRP
ncbi:hypothetical protein BDU57DRAFT_521368 [Ampelomyces quisqualis]|uniref:Uncharacterized protein n=1 Tax=Ampelomyces quisqualis TaxID=50730 RepID=A0A6A5QD75_AMPQU|nr:hypothetical protein BDU57DRAFT_521368 [Ampelomyces quisqualis]